jgi:hypothetical protein
MWGLTHLVAVSTLTACWSSHLIDPPGHVVRSPSVVANASELRLVADSGTRGWRIVAELFVELPAHSVALTTPDMSLRLSDNARLTPTAVARDSFVCSRPPGRWDPEATRHERRPGRSPADAPQRCVQLTTIVRAEFALRRQPQLGDSVHFTYGNRTVGARWASASRKH